MHYRIGIDLGGTKIEGVLMRSEGEVLQRRRIPTRQTDGYDAILGRIHDLYRSLVADCEHAPHTLGIGTPGALSARTGLLKNSNTLCLNGKPLDHDLKQLLNHPLQVMNDANCFAFAEAILGAGRAGRMVFGVIMGTGCGGGLVIDQQVWTGPQSIGGEWGHMSIQPDGPLCYCGQRGCVETWISGGGLEKRWHQEQGSGRVLSDILADYRVGEPRAVHFIQSFLEYFGRALANVINLLDPDVIVLGGGVSNIDELYTDGVREVAKRVFNDTLNTPIVRHQLGDSSGVIGAALVGI